MIAPFATLEALRAISEAAAGSLLAAIWQGTLLAAVAALGLRLVPRTPAGVRFAIWFAVFSLVAILPFLAFAPHAAPTDPVTAPHAWLTLDPRWSLALFALWAFASLIRAVTLAVAAFRVRALWRRATPIEIPASATTPAAEICTSTEVDRPSVIGFFHPRILIPAWLINKLTPAELDHVILHEAGHLRRRDDWLNLLQKLALVIFPLNPALAWVERRLCFERELACDDRVLSATGAPKAYAACLAALAEHRLSRRGFALVMGLLGSGRTRRPSELGRRVHRILSRTDSIQRGTARLVLGGAFAILILVAAALIHAPRLIAFTSPADGIAMAPARPALDAGSKPLVFNASYTNQNAAPEVLLKATVPGRTRPHVLHAAARHIGSPTQRGWIVTTSVTAWATPSGPARVVMTTTTISASPSMVRTTAAAPDQRPGPSPQLTRAAQPFPPYAAVPVQGGWLVFQL